MKRTLSFHHFLFLFVLMSWLPLSACTVESDTKVTEKNEAALVLSSGETVTIRLAVTMAEKIQGLSGLREDEFDQDEGMFFVYAEDGPKQFWMPDTYFDLDIFFLDKDLTVLDVERNVPYHPGREEPPPIARTRSIFSHHVLEMRADSELAKRIEVGDRLEWRGQGSLEEMVKENHSP